MALNSTVSVIATVADRTAASRHRFDVLVVQELVWAERPP